MSTAQADAEAADRLDSVRRRIAAAAIRAGREPESARLIGVSKRQPIARVASAVRAGLRDLGENYVQEAHAKRAALGPLLPPGVAAPRWRMIGSLQRNKAGIAVDTFDAIDSVDRTSLAAALDRRAGARGVLEICLQVNLSGEAQKAGCAEEDLEPLLQSCQSMDHLRVVGLMTIPAANADPEATRPVFAHLAALLAELRSAPGGDALSELSMGMSADFEVAVEEGATLVRVGTALFGPRAAMPPVPQASGSQQ